MANEILYGAGAPVIETTQLQTNELLPIEPMSIEISGESDSLTSQKFAEGLLVTAGSVQSSQSFTMTIGIQAIDWVTMQFAYGLKSAVTATVDLPVMRYATIPSTSPYEIVDTDITTDQVRVAFVGGAALTATESTPATGEFEVDTASTKLVFATADAGKAIAYRVLKTYTNIRSIGAESAVTPLRAFEFYGTVFNGNGDRYGLKIPNMSRLGIPTLSLTGDAAQFDLEFELIVGAGKLLPFELYDLPTT